MLLRLLVEELGGLVVLRAEGEIDTSTADNLTQAVDAALEPGGVRLAVDLSQVTFVDSAGASALLAAHRSAIARGGRLGVVSPSGQVLRLLRLLGLDGALRLFDDVPTAERDL
jgi:anti-sigma B factor antagonist